MGGFPVDFQEKLLNKLVWEVGWNRRIVRRLVVQQDGTGRDIGSCGKRRRRPLC